MGGEKLNVKIYTRKTEKYCAPTFSHMWRMPHFHVTAACRTKFDSHVHNKQTDEKTMPV